MRERWTRARRSIGAAAAAALGATLAIAPAAPLRAATFPVATVAELRAAISTANGENDGIEDIITLANAGPYLLTCGTDEDANVDGDLDYNSSDDLTITYAGPGRATIAVDQTSPCTNERVFHHRGTGTVSFERVVITGGDLSGTEGYFEGSGGGIAASVAGGSIDLLDVVVEGNRAGDADSSASPRGGFGGGVFVYDGTLAVTDSTVRGNRAGDGADATTSNAGAGGAGGGLAIRVGALVITDSVLQGNRAGDGGAGSGSGFAGLGGDGGGAAAVFGGTITVVGGVIGGATPDLGNQAGDAGPAAAGGGRNGGLGGGLLGAFDETTTLTDVEIAHNRAGASSNDDAAGSGSNTGGSGGGVHSAGTLVLDGVHVHHNLAGAGASRTTERGDDGGDGGGVHSAGLAATLEIRDSIIEDNAAGPGGDSDSTPGSGGRGGGVVHRGQALTIEQSVVARNTSGDGGDGGAAAVGGSSGNGGGVYVTNFAATFPTATISDTGIVDNAAGTGGVGGAAAGIAGNGAGVDARAGTMTIERSLLAGNSGARFGGGLHAITDVTVVNSTLHANSATGQGGGVYGGVNGTRTIRASTLTQNGAPIGASIHEVSNDVTLERSVVAEPAGAVANCDGAGGVVDGGGNLEQHPTGVGTCLPPSLVVQDPLGFGPLQDNGGHTLTRLPAPDSQLVDGLAVCIEPVDQRGSTRPNPVGGACDIGAVELDQSITATADGVASIADEATIDVLANDITVDGVLDPTSVTVTSGPASGTTEVDATTGAITYTPTVSGDVSDTFTYSVCLDGLPSRCAAAVVTVDLTRPDTTPAAFSFDAITDVVPLSVQTSNAVAVSDVNLPAPITVTGGQYSVNGGPFTSAPGTVVTGDSVRARHTASADSFGAVSTTVTIGGVSGTFTSTTQGIEAPTGAASFVPLDPERLFDTRDGAGLDAAGKIDAGGTLDVQIGGRLGVPADAVAVVLNLTVAQPETFGYVTAFPAGGDAPLASNLNVTAPGQVRPNLVIVPLGDGGRISIFSAMRAHLLGDVAGYFTGVDVGVRSGRLVPLRPQRVFDTRPDSEAPGPKGFVGADRSITVQVTGRAGVPQSGVSAVVLNVTGVRSGGAGNYVTVWPTGQDRPLASNLNLGDGDTAANLVIVPVGDGGRVDLYTFEGAHLLADVTGYITDATADDDIAGLFMPLVPGRVFDTREDTTPPGPKGFVPPDGTITAQITGVAGIPADAAAVALNITGIRAPAGYVTVYPTGEDRPLASTLNLLGASDVRPNAAILPVGASGRMDFYAFSGAHLAADASGYFLGS